MPLYLNLLSMFEGYSAAATYTNPLKASQGSDPFIVWHEGYYYLLTTTWTNVQIARATTLGGLKTASPKIIWSDATPSRCCNVWAPEVHCYYVAGSSDTLDNQRIHVLRGDSNIIWDSKWTYSGRIAIPNRDIWAIDPTILIIGSNRYLVYSSNDGAQGLWIAPLTGPTTVGNTIRISEPSYSWEKVGFGVNEGPAALYHGGKTFIVFSASYCDGTGYKLGRLDFTGTDPMSASAWTKYANPIFSSANGNYQPGHNGFFLSPSGNQIWNVYHASKTSPGACDGSRYTLAQPVNWNSDGSPNLGSPLSLSTSITEPV
ncbi:glycoside hydrolase family 43 protein [Crepidotus variabilis]|uniref:Glycoside hydrolase family 43 protein n=1 Tax=Crepidotus variabilis TaxID=179855 RepID=A0A9P6EJY4_9AGAR|nr:glycoside hydrolase family 43 protein [Crepidotus variabilis]